MAEIVISGEFSTQSEFPRYQVARLLPDGSLDADFDRPADDWVNSIAVQPDGKALIGGWFTAIGGERRDSIARFNLDGSLDSGFHPNANSAVDCITVHGDDRILVGGAFTAIGGTLRNGIARLNPDGSVDTDFNPDADGRVYTIALQADGKILIGGEFTTIGGVARNHIARLNPNGSLDTGFSLDADGPVYSIAVQPDSKILLGGEFTTVGGLPRTHMARLNANGSLDTGFNPSVNTESGMIRIASIALQADGKILIGGFFTMVGGVTRNRIARLNPDGSLDPGFDPDADNWVSSIAVLTNGKTLIGGGFTALGGITRSRIARLNPNGSLDTDFDLNVNNSINSIAIQSDGRIFIGGLFTSVGGVERKFVARLSDPEAAVQEIGVSLDGLTVTWMRGQASPEVWRVTFEYSEDALTWTKLGDGTRIPDGWQLKGGSLPIGPNHHIRARGYAMGGSPAGSGSLFESVRMYYLRRPFDDVPTGHWAQNHILAIYDAGITWGCSANPPLFCPEDVLTRAQMATFIETSLGMAALSLPACSGTVFNDVNRMTVGEVLCRFIEDFAARGITGGCSSNPSLFCPHEPVTRQQMGIFLEAALGKNPCAIAGDLFWNLFGCKQWNSGAAVRMPDCRRLCGPGDNGRLRRGNLLSRRSGDARPDGRLSGGGTSPPHTLNLVIGRPRCENRTQL